MKLCNIGQDFRYELEKLIRIFLPFEKIEISNEILTDSRLAVVKRAIDENTALLSAQLDLDGKSARFSESLSIDVPDYEKECERVLAVQLFKCFNEITGYMPHWGILTGVRPAKLFSRLCEKNGVEATIEYFSKGLLVHPEKISLCKETNISEKKITDLSRPDSFSLYISIPFCPTRCAYCSFVSHSISQAGRLIEDYIVLLCKEIKATADIAKKLSLRLETIYIGGGTPTSLSALQLEKIMTAVRESFDLSALREYTVEAGRPDTITAEKLEAILKNGATRISINPQSMNDNVLEAVGRKHTAAQTVEAFKLARKIGFNNINTDLIAGLPEDTLGSFRSTLNQILELNPESVTVHSLSMKRASTLTIHGRMPEIKTGEVASLMVDEARKTLCEKGIVPYYMYRQSKTVGNLENVGYAKKGYECIYNVYIMDETHTILACGASAVTKLREPHGNFIERIFNFKYPYEYISRFEEQISRKEGILRFYEKYPTNNQP